MSFFESLSDISVTLDNIATSVTAEDRLRANIKDIHPDALSSAVDEVLVRAGAAVEEALGSSMHSSDRLAVAVLIGSAVATSMQGWEDKRGRWKDGLIPKGKDPALFWKTRLSSTATRAIINSAELDDDYTGPKTPSASTAILMRYAQKNNGPICESVREIIERYGGQGGIYEGMLPKIGDVYTLCLDESKAQELESELLSAKDTNSIDTSWHITENGDIILGWARSCALVLNPNDPLALGTLAHEIAHGFTAHLTRYIMFGHYDGASLLAEVLAEHGRATLRYPSDSYREERAFQWAMNDMVGYDIIGAILAEYRASRPNSNPLVAEILTNLEGHHNVTFTNSPELAERYMKHAIKAGGIVFASLVLGAIPRVYLDHDNTNFPGHDISLLDSGKHANRYSVLQHYVPDPKRYELIDMGSFDGLWQETNYSPMASDLATELSSSLAATKPVKQRRLFRGIRSI